MNAAELQIHVLPIAKHPPVSEIPTFEVEVALPAIVNPERVVVPKPTDETESCVAVDEPTTNPTVSPAIGLTDRRPNGVVDANPIVPEFVNVVVAVPPIHAV